MERYRGFTPADPDTWENKINEYYFPISAKPIGPRFRGNIKRINLGSMALVRCASDAAFYQRSKHHVSMLAKESFLVTIPIISDALSAQRGREARFRPREMFIERVHEPFLYTQPDRNLIVTLCVDGSEMRDHLSNADAYCGSGFDMSRGLGRMLADLMLNTASQADDLGDAERTVIGRHVLELLTLLLRNDERAIKSGLSSVRSAHLQRVDKVISARLHDVDLDPSSIAESCGISLRYLHQIFGETEYTVTRYILRRKLLAAQMLLRERADLKLAEVAYRCGFNDHATLSRQFKREFGMSPSDYRTTI